MLKKPFLIVALATAVAGAGTLSPSAFAGDPLLGALIGGGIGAAIGHGVDGRTGAWVGGTLGAVTGASIAASSGGYYGGGYYGGATYYGRSNAYGAPTSAYYGTSARYYAPVPAYRAPAVIYRPGPVYTPARLPRYPLHDGRYGWNTGGHRSGVPHSYGAAHGYERNRYDR